MAVSPRLQAAIAAHRFGLGEPDLAVVGDDAARLARGADRPGRSRRAATACSTRRAALRARRRGARETRAGEESAARHDRRAGAGRPLSRDPASPTPASRLATAAATAAAVRRAAAAGSGPTTSPSRSLKGSDPRPGRRVRARRDPAEHRRPLRDPAGRRDHPSGDAALPRQLALRRAALARRRARSAARRATRRRARASPA